MILQGSDIFIAPATTSGHLEEPSDFDMMAA